MSIKFMKINKYEPAEDERKLEKLAAEGKFIKWYCLGLAFFKKGEPKKVKYCIEPSLTGAGRKLRAAYAESGWGLAAKDGRFNVFMSEDENAVPLHTDRSEYAHVVKKFHHHSLLQLIFLFLLSVIDFTIPLFFFPLITGGKVQAIFTIPLRYDLAGEFVKTSVAIGIIVFPILLIYLLDFVKAGRFVTGCIENKSDAEKAVRRNRIMTGFFVVLLALNAAVIIFYAYASSNNKVTDINFSQLNSDIIEADEIYTENIEFLLTDEAAEKFIDPELWNGSFNAFTSIASSTTSVFTDCHYNYQQHFAYIPDGKEKGRKLYLNNTYTVFKNEWLAEKGADEFIEYEHFFFRTTADRIRLDTNGTVFDKAEYLISDGSLYMVLLKSDTLHTIDTKIPPESDFTPEIIFEHICYAQ